MATGAGTWSNSARMSSVTPLSAAWPATANGRAIVFMVAAMACFICNDTLVKSVSYTHLTLPTNREV